MIFRRKKPSGPPVETPAMRGRNRPETGDNPLARRFHPEDEPDTIDLDQTPGFPAEPGTADLASKKPEPGGTGVILLNAGTGKLYAHPAEGVTVFLEDEPVLAATELRPGDRLRIGGLVMELTRAGKTEPSE